MTATPAFVAALETELYHLYATANLGEVALEMRAQLARLYHTATGRWFAARFYY